MRARRLGEDHAFDTSVPLLVVKVGRYPRHHGTLGVIRSLGRVGVPVYAITEDAFTPAARSRYLAGRIVAPTSGLEPVGALVARLHGAARRVGRPTIVLPSDDEAAVLVAAHRDELAPALVVPDVDATLVTSLASKRGLHELCLANGVPTPAAAFPSSREDLERCAAESTFPVVTKAVEPFRRLEAPELRATRRFETPEELLAAFPQWPGDRSLMLQEYLPADVCEDWIFHGYFDARSNCLVGFTGVKHRSWPPGFGVTTSATSVANPTLAAASVDFCRRIGYRGIVDMDWRLDRRDGAYRLLDCNPRIGAQFRLFENEVGIDVARALHLDLTGRDVPRAPQVDGRSFVVENLDLAARLLAGHRTTSRADRPRPASTERAWFTWDDPAPFALMAIRQLGPIARRVAGRLGR